MTLTVPSAPPSAGARAPTLRVETPQTGAAIADFGAVVQEVGTRIEADRLDREAQQLQLDITRDLGAARLEFEQMTDPDQIDRLWPQRMAELRQSYLQGNREDGRPRVDPKLRGRIGMVFQELGDRHALALAGNALALRHSQRAATYIAYQAETGAQAATADLGTVDTLIQGRLDQIDQLERAGTFTAEQAAAERVKATGEVLNAHVIGLIDRDPAAFLEQADAGLFDRLGGEALAQRRVQAQGALDRQAAAAATEADRLAAERNTAIGRELDAMIDLYGRDVTPAQEAILTSPDVQAHPKYGQAVAARDLRNEMPGLRQMSVGELREAIAAERGTPRDRPYQTERLAALEQLLKQKTDALAADPVAHAQATYRGFDPIAGLSSFDPSPEGRTALRDGLAQRVSNVGWLADREGLNPASTMPLSREEQAAVRAQLTSLPPDQRVALSADLQRSLGGAARAILADSPVVAWAGSMVARGGVPEAVATEVLRGQDAIDQGNVILPPAANRLGVQFEEFEDVFADLPGEDVQASVRAAADALYAARSRRTGPIDELNERQYAQALHEVLGGTGAYDGRDARGGIQRYNDALIPLPPSVHVSEVEDAFARIGQVAEVQPGRRGETVRTRDDAATLADQLARISVTGDPPTINGQPVEPDDLRGYSLRAVGGGTYAFVWNGQVLTTGKGDEYHFRLSDPNAPDLLDVVRR